MEWLNLQFELLFVLETSEFVLLAATRQAHRAAADTIAGTYHKQLIQTTGRTRVIPCIKKGCLWTVQLCMLTAGQQDTSHISSRTVGRFTAGQ